MTKNLISLAGFNIMVAGLMFLDHYVGRLLSNILFHGCIPVLPVVSYTLSLREMYILTFYRTSPLRVYF